MYSFRLDRFPSLLDPFPLGNSVKLIRPSARKAQELLRDVHKELRGQNFDVSRARSLFSVEDTHSHERSLITASKDRFTEKLRARCTLETQRMLSDHRRRRERLGSRSSKGSLVTNRNTAVIIIRYRRSAMSYSQRERNLYGSAAEIMIRNMGRNTGVAR